MSLSITLWCLLGGAMILFMHGGFCMLEAGFIRSKTTGTVIVNNLTDFSICGLLFWAFGMGFAFNGTSGWFGGWDFCSQADYSSIFGGDMPSVAYILIQTIFASTVAAIVGGAILERAKFASTLIASALMSGIVYPIACCWVWNPSGWLAQMGIHDFAGGLVLHAFGGIIALIAAIFVGPRIGKYSNGKSNAMPASSLPLAALGTFMLYFGWYFFNSALLPATEAGAGEFPIAADIAARVFMNNTLAASAATMAVLFLEWIMRGKPSVAMCINAPLAGLVAITSCCDAVPLWASPIIGGVAGIGMYLAIRFIDEICHIDDAVGAFGVHCISGVIGMIGCGFFADGLTTEAGLFFGGGGHLLGVQALGCAAVLAFGAAAMAIIYAVLKFTIGVRVKPEQEKAGTDITAFGLEESSYPEFVQVDIDPTQGFETPFIDKINK